MKSYSLRHQLPVVFLGLFLGFTGSSAQADQTTSPTKDEPTLIQKIIAKQAEAKSQADGSKTKKKKEAKYIRLRLNEKKQPIALEVATVSFQPPKPGKNTPTVDLIGAVHMAEPEFFDRLNKKFAGYDAVLYELIAPEGTRPVGGKKPGGTNPLSAMQTGMTKLLNLEFQLEGVDYQKPNFVHADMSPDEFRKSMEDRGESVLSIFARMMAYSMLQQAKDPSGSKDAELLMAFFDKNRSLALKRAMAKQFEDMGGALLVLDGPDGSTLISQRNAKALDVLRRELKAGKRKIAIFYGAGHLPDMAKRLKKDFGLIPTNTTWLRAWNMEEPKKIAPTVQRKKQ